MIYISNLKDIKPLKYVYLVRIREPYCAAEVDSVYESKESAQKRRDYIFARDNPNFENYLPETKQDWQESYFVEERELL